MSTQASGNKKVIKNTDDANVLVIMHITTVSKRVNTNMMVNKVAIASIKVYTNILINKTATVMKKADTNIQLSKMVTASRRSDIYVIITTIVHCNIAAIMNNLNIVTFAKKNIYLVEYLLG